MRSRGGRIPDGELGTAALIEWHAAADAPQFFSPKCKRPPLSGRFCQAAKYVGIFNLMLIKIAQKRLAFCCIPG